MRTKLKQTGLALGLLLAGLNGLAAPTLDGRVTGLERINAKTARSADANRTWRGCAWRNERVHMPFVVWGEGKSELRAEAKELTGPDGARLPVTVSWVGEVIVDDRPHDAPVDPAKYPPYLSGDVLETEQPFRLTDAGYRAVWASVKTPANAAPGLYRGSLTVTDGSAQVAFAIELEILSAALPKDRKFHLDIWQTPWTIARYYGVTPFSSAHYAKMEPFLRELAEAGQKAITTTITDYPWNVRKNIDSARSMVKYVKRRDGTFAADFTVMDEYVAFAEKCGIGPQIHCYAPVKFEHSNTYQYVDEATGEEVSVKLLPATPEYEAYWGPLLTQLEAHARAKGWQGRLYIALDELPGRETAATAALIAKYAPSAKFHMSGNRTSESFAGVAIDGYSQQLGSKLMSKAFLQGLDRRRAEGRFTTIYTCCNPFRPNALPMSPLYEQRWLGLYIAAKGFDGYLKSTFFRWVQDTDPLKDAHCYPRFPCGDSFLVYPGPRLSLRWQSLVDAIEDCEKIRVLRASDGMTPELEAALAAVDLANFSSGAAERPDAVVAKALAALEAASRTFSVERKIGIIGCDTSHAIAFARIANVDRDPRAAGFRVAAAYQWGSRDIVSSTNRYPEYLKKLADMGVEMKPSIAALLAEVDCVLLETNDGRPHYEQALEVFKSGKPVFIDKPVAADLADAVKIVEAGRRLNAKWFCTSTLRFQDAIDEVKSGKYGKLRGVETFSPYKVEPTQSRYFWYAIHGAEPLFALLGTGCREVRCIAGAHEDILVGTWADGRIGVQRALDVNTMGGAGYGGSVQTEKGCVALNGYKGYQPLLAAIMDFFRTGRAPVSPEETLEVYAFLAAAERSYAEGGRTVTLEEVLAAARTPSVTEVMVSFDTEDFTDPYNADAIRELADLCTEEGVTASFETVGLLAEQLENWGRKDIVAAMRRHLIGTHSYGHSVHPNIMEMSAAEDYATAYRSVRAVEEKSVGILRRLFGVERIWTSAPAGNSEPYVAGRVYADLDIPLDLGACYLGRRGRDAWFGGQYRLPYAMCMDGLFAHDSDFNLEKELDKLAMGTRVAIYTHPNRVRSPLFWDGLNYEGTNACTWGKWKLSPRREAADVARGYARMRSLFRALKADSRFRLVSASEIASELRPRVAITRADVPRLRAALEKKLGPVDAPASWCVADVFCAAVAFLRGEASHLPDRAYGFLYAPEGVTNATTVAREDLVAAAKAMDVTGFLPHRIDVGGRKIGPADFLFAALEALETGAATVTVKPREQLGEFDVWPRLANVRYSGTWMHAPDFDDTWPKNRIKWQLWTLRFEPRPSAR